MYALCTCPHLCARTHALDSHQRIRPVATMRLGCNDALLPEWRTSRPYDSGARWAIVTMTDVSKRSRPFSLHCRCHPTPLNRRRSNAKKSPLPACAFACEWVRMSMRHIVTTTTTTITTIISMSMNTTKWSHERTNLEHLSSMLITLTITRITRIQCIGEWSVFFSYSMQAHPSTFSYVSSSSNACKPQVWDFLGNGRRIFALWW